MKTPKEIKAGLRCHAVQWHAGECPDHEPGCKGCPYENDYHDPDEVMADALELIEELQAKIPQWIDIKKRSPEMHQRVLFISTGHERVCVGNYHGEGKKGGHYFLTSNRLETAKWWMPTPELPEEEV